MNDDIYTKIEDGKKKIQEMQEYVSEIFEILEKAKEKLKEPDTVYLCMFLELANKYLQDNNYSEDSFDKVLFILKGTVDMVLAMRIGNKFIDVLYEILNNTQDDNIKK